MAVVCASFAVLVVGSDRRALAAAEVQAVLADTAAVGSGRAEFVVRYLDDEGRATYRQAATVEFSGDDYAVRSSSDAPDGGMRVVDGELYSSLFDDGVRTWFHENGPDEPAAPFALDPRTLLDQLRVDGDFRVVGDEEVDGAATTQLEANAPEAIPGRTAAFFIPGAFHESEGPAIQEVTVTSLDLWVGEDDLVRRLDLAVTSSIVSGFPDLTDEERDSHWSFSMRFFDFGAPITVEAPEDYVETPPS